jgi:hypothetical protein
LAFNLTRQLEVLSHGLRSRTGPRQHLGVPTARRPGFAPLSSVVGFDADFPHRPSHSSCCTNGLAISSLPSTGLTSTSSVPLATTKPSDRDDSFPSSSGGRESAQVGSVESGTAYLTSQNLRYIIENQIHECIVALQSTSDCKGRIVSQGNPPLPCAASDGISPSLPPLNLTVICLSMYLPRSRMFSFLGLSVCPCWAPPLPP